MRYILAMVLMCAITLAEDTQRLLAHYRKAVGDISKLQQLKSWAIVGKMSSQDGSWQRSYRMWSSGDKLRTELILQPGIISTMWTDGEHGWAIQPWSQSLDPQPLNAASLFRLRCWSRLLVNDLVQSQMPVEFGGTEEIEGSDCYKLRCRHRDGSVWTYYLDPDAFLPVKISVEAVLNGEHVAWEASFGNYRTIEGILLPTEISSSGSVTIVKHYELNPVLDDALFASPVK